jgi:hypothetical protein
MTRQRERDLEEQRNSAERTSHGHWRKWQEAQQHEQKLRRLLRAVLDETEPEMIEPKDINHPEV